MRSRDCAVSMSGNSTKDGTRCSGGEHRFTYPATRRTVKPFAHYIPLHRRKLERERESHNVSGFERSPPWVLEAGRRSIGSVR